MKSYWIVAAAVVSMAWPASSNAYLCAGQIKAEATTVEQAPSTNGASAKSDSVRIDSAKAASGTPANTPHTPTMQAKAGDAQNKSSYLLVELSKTLKANKLKPGDKIKAEVSQDVVAHGKVIIPVETELVGHVTEVSVRKDGTGVSRLGFVFDRILLKHYHDINLQAVVQAVAAPVQRRSKVDEPSQMLPPSMVAGGERQSGGPIPGRPGSSSRGSTAAAPSPMGGSGSPIFQAPLTVKQSPSTNVASGSAAAQLSTAPETAAPMSVGMPQGVTGLKGLSLTTGTTAETPGPVVISNTDNVKLESGTQVLLRVMTVETPTQTQTK